jgi:hypothetical protein
MVLARRLRHSVREATMAQARRAAIRVGVAGWDYKDWHGVLYPPGLGRGGRLGFLARFVPRPPRRRPRPGAAHPA